MHHLFDNASAPDSGNGGTGTTGIRKPPVDIYEMDDGLVLTVELPGVSKDEVTVELHEQTLTLSGERKRETAVKGGACRREEGHYGAFQRAFRLPMMVDEAKVQATYKDGVLTLRLPKHAAAQPKGIAITD
jgi:HSP20 family protein